MRPKSQAIYQAACTIIPGGVHSPVRAFPGLDLTPLIVSHGKDDQIWDVDGHKYIDYCGSWGALILGHAAPQVVQAAAQQLERGSSFGISTEIEQQFTAELLRHFPSMDKMRFVSSGTEATMSAVRLARGYTGRPLLVKFDGNYHGHADSMLIRAGSGVSHLKKASSKGIPAGMVRYTVSLPFNDVEGVRDFLRSRKDVAAVIVEPIAGNMGVVPATPAFLQMLREETKMTGALLIIDEVITGFRVGIKGAQGKYGIVPDLTCLGKIIGGGFPAAAFGGKKEIMDHLAPLGPVYQAGTLSGNPVALAAGQAALKQIETQGFYEKLNQKTNFLLDPIQECIRQKNLPVCLQREASMFTLFLGVREVKCKSDLDTLDHALFKRYFQTLFGKGIYMPPSAYEAAFVSQAHTLENLAFTRDAILDFLKEL